jgi:RNA polymerase sigma-54 factor
MAGFSQTQSLSQQQVLAPQLQQSLLILQAPVLELRNLIQQEIQTNPTLEEDFSDNSAPERQGEPAEFQEEFEQLARLDEEWRDYMTQNSAFSNGGPGFEEDRRQFFFDSIVKEETLQQHLLEQMAISEFSPEETKIAELIIGNVDDVGFLQTSVEEMAAGSGIPVEDVERVLEVVQTFHPVGVAARDLRDCLLIQLRRLAKENTLEWRIVDRFLEDLGKRRFPEIARRLSTTVELVQRAANFIATLDPKPGQLFTPDPNNYVLPDVFAEKVGGEWQVLLNADQIPRLRISNVYKDLMSQDGSGTEVKDYIRDKIRSGKFLIKSIQQRQQTISNISNEIVARQRDFMEKGPSALRPMTMVMVADAVGVHETTVSRAIAGKYMATPHGVFDMKYFFTPGYQVADGDALSNTSVKGAIEDLVREEDHHNPMSDKEIVDRLARKGIPIARRTVAKYRAELNILPSNMRKQY